MIESVSKKILSLLKCSQVFLSHSIPNQCLSIREKNCENFKRISERFLLKFSIQKFNKLSILSTLNENLKKPNFKNEFKKQTNRFLMSILFRNFELKDNFVKFYCIYINENIYLN